MNVKPLSDRVLILPNPAEEKTAGGLIIPDTAKEKPLAGKVVAVGPGTSEVKMEVKVGDEVLYGKYRDGKSAVLLCTAASVQHEAGNIYRYCSGK